MEIIIDMPKGHEKLKEALEKKIKKDYGIVVSNKPDHLASLKVIKPKKEKV